MFVPAYKNQIIGNCFFNLNNSKNMGDITVCLDTFLIKNKLKFETTYQVRYLKIICKKNKVNFSQVQVWYKLNTGEDITDTTFDVFEETTKHKAYVKAHKYVMEEIKKQKTYSDDQIERISMYFYLRFFKNKYSTKFINDTITHIINNF